MDEIGSGTHERFIVNWDRFNKSVAGKAAKANAEVDA
jgi:predicted thioesterase